jgi:hypothetical protein
VILLLSLIAVTALLVDLVFDGSDSSHGIVSTVVADDKLLL